MSMSKVLNQQFNKIILIFLLKKLIHIGKNMKFDIILIFRNFVIMDFI